jgi:hypothetical protein
MVSNIVDDCSFWVEERSKKPRNWRKIEHTVRIRAMRGRTFDSRWRRLRLVDTGEVVQAE